VTHTELTGVVNLTAGEIHKMSSTDDDQHLAMAESLIVNIVNDDQATLDLILSMTGDVELWRSVSRYELDIARLVDVGGPLQYDVVVPKLVRWETRTVSAFHLAAMRGADGILERFVQQLGVPVDVPLHSEATALHFACFAGQLDTARTLVDKFHANINRRDGYTHTLYRD
jgi:hypothetical protein